MGILLTSHKNLSSAILDSIKLAEAFPLPSTGPVGAHPTGARKKNTYFDAASQLPHRQEPPSPEEAAKKKVKHTLREAEKKPVIFNLDLGPVPTINKDTLSRKVTVALSDKAKAGNHGDTEYTIDDVLSCSKLEFMGSSTRSFHNRKNENDAKNGKFCTIPVRLDFKDKETRIQAEISLKKRKGKLLHPIPKKPLGHSGQPCKRR